VPQSWRCPICRGVLYRRRPSFPGEQPQQAHLPTGWDCDLMHAARTPPAQYEDARIQMLISDIQAYLDFQAITSWLE